MTETPATIQNTSPCCGETISRPNPGHGPWSCDNCHRELVTA